MSAPNEFSSHRITSSTRAVVLIQVVLWMGFASLGAYVTLVDSVWLFGLSSLPPVIAKNGAVLVPADAHYRQRDLLNLVCL